MDASRLVPEIFLLVIRSPRWHLNAWFVCLKKKCCHWWHKTLIPALRRERQAGLREFRFKASLINKVSSRITKTVMHRNSVLKNKQTKNKQNRKTYGCLVQFSWVGKVFVDTASSKVTKDLEKHHQGS